MRRLAFSLLLAILAVPSWSQSAQDFADAGEIITLGDVNEMDSVGAFTVGAWIKTDTIAGGGSNLRNILTKETTGFILRLATATDAINFYINGGGTPAVSAVITTGVWYCVVGTFDRTLSTRIKLYVNNALTTSTGVDANTSANVFTVDIGASTNAPTRDWDGRIAHAFIHGGVAWSAERVAEFCAGNLSAAYGVTAYLPLWHAATPFDDLMGNYDGSCTTCPAASSDGPPVFLPGGGQ